MGLFSRPKDNSAALMAQQQAIMAQQQAAAEAAKREAEAKKLADEQKVAADREQQESARRALVAGLEGVDDEDSKKRYLKGA